MSQLGPTDHDYSGVVVNHFGYLGGDSKFRDFVVSDGKKGTVAYFDGSSKAVKFGGNVLPSADNSIDLGSTALRWANLYVGDMHLKNDRGDWTVIEEEEYLSLKNNKNGKTYKIAMEEV